MQTIPVIFSRSALPFSLLIRLMDRQGGQVCPFSHVGIISQCGNYVYESRGKVGVVKTPLWEFKRKASHWELGRFPTVNRRAAYERAEALLGAGYDWLGVISLGIPFIGHDWQDPDKWWCSEYLAHCSGIFEHRHVKTIGVAFCYALTRERK
jgi:hypothetical protein